MNARLNVTYAGQNGDLLDPVLYDATDQELRAIAEEAIINGSIPGITADDQASLGDFVVDRFPAGEGVTENRLVIRPKTPFGRV